MIRHDDVILIEFDPDPDVHKWAVYLFPAIKLKEGILEAFNGLSEEFGYSKSLAEQIKAAKSVKDANPEDFANHQIVVIDPAWSLLDDQKLPFSQDQYMILETEMDELEAVLRYQ